MANGDDEKIRRMHEQAERERRAAEKARKQGQEFARRRAEQEKQKKRDADNARMIRETSDRLRRQNNAKKDAYSKRNAAKKDSGQGCAILLLAGTTGLVLLTALSQIIRVFS